MIVWEKILHYKEKKKKIYIYIYMYILIIAVRKTGGKRRVPRPLSKDKLALGREEAKN